MFFLVFCASLFVSQIQSTGESVTAKKPQETQEEQSPLLSPENKDKEKSELLSELALREQQERLRDLEAQKAKKKPETPPKTEQPAKRNAPEPRPRSTPRQPSPPPVRYERPPAPRFTAARYSPPSPPLNNALPSPARDPHELWAELSQVGSFGSGTMGEGSPVSERPTPRYQPQKVTQTVDISPTLANGSSSDAITFGQSVPATLETAIAWEGGRTNRTELSPDDRYLLTLTEPLEDQTGNLLIPSGSQVVVRLEGNSNAIANLVAESIIIDGVETELPQGSLKIRGAKGQPLIPEMRKLGDNNRDDAEFFSDILSIAGDFADIPGSRSISSLYRTFTGGRNRRGSGVTATIFYLRQGTPLEVFVNKSFNLNVPEQPLELDFSSQSVYLEGDE
jgi:hypothetical protein